MAGRRSKVAPPGSYMPPQHIRGQLLWTLAVGKSLFNRVFYNPDTLGTLLEDLFVEVWVQEQFERQHPFTCAVIRENSPPSEPDTGNNASLASRSLLPPHKAKKSVHRLN